jgi:hypothetical protein
MKPFNMDSNNALTSSSALAFFMLVELNYKKREKRGGGREKEKEKEKKRGKLEGGKER